MKRALLVVLVAATAHAGGNSPENAQQVAEEEVLAKLALRCGVPITTRYDAASLKAKNKDIGWDQTGGNSECDEPLRYLWALCSSPEGKAQVRRAELRQVVCRGVDGAVGALTVKSGVVTVDRAYEEPKPHLRSRAQFEAALKVKLSLGSEDPYYDSAWADFRREPNPVTSTTDYCLVNGEKVAFDWSAPDSLRGDGTVKCLEAGVVVIDLTLKGRRKTGLNAWARDEVRVAEHLVDGRRDGLEERRESKVLRYQALHRAGERVWSKDFHDSGALKSYMHQYPGLQVSMEARADGALTGLHCAPEAKDDEVLKGPCGFAGEKTHDIFDGTNAVSRTITLKNGQLTRQVAGTSRYASRSTVSFVDGKKDREERVTRTDGTLESTVAWKRGVQHGPERRYSADGKRVVEESRFTDGTLVERTTWYLNGNKELVERYDEQALHRVRSYDLGAVQEEGTWVRCQRARGWCEDGLHTAFFENGKPANETTWRKGQRHGPSKTWHLNGRQRWVDEYQDDRLLRRKEFDEQGALVADDEYEADGSRKVRR